MTTELMLYGDIGADWWSGDGITEEQVHTTLQTLDSSASKHTVRINSPGGRVDTGLSIMNLLRSHKAQMKVLNPEYQLETVCDGYAMSIASVIFMAGDIRTVALGGILMIHEAWSGCYGNAAEMKKCADNLDLHSQNISNIYATLATPADKDEPARDAAYFRELMKAETYMISDDCVKKGLATQLDTGLTASIDASFTPEILQGKYVSLMTAGYKKRTFTKPTASKSLLDAKLAQQRLKSLLATLS
jgi:ATP-dependent protease ClpP protease subunit